MTIKDMVEVWKEQLKSYEDQIAWLDKGLNAYTGQKVATDEVRERVVKWAQELREAIALYDE